MNNDDCVRVMRDKCKELHAQAVENLGEVHVYTLLQRFYRRLAKKTATQPATDDYQAIVADFNAVTGNSLLLSTFFKELIKPLLAKGYTTSDFHAVHAHKTAEWGKNDEMRKYLRPTTLWRPNNFARYLEEAKSPRHSGTYLQAGKKYDF